MLANNLAIKDNPRSNRLQSHTHTHTHTWHLHISIEVSAYMFLYRAHRRAWFCVKWSLQKRQTLVLQSEKKATTLAKTGVESEFSTAFPLFRTLYMHRSIFSFGV